MFYETSISRGVLQNFPSPGMFYKTSSSWGVLQAAIFWGVLQNFHLQGCSTKLPSPGVFYKLPSGLLQSWGSYGTYKQDMKHNSVKIILHTRNNTRSKMSAEMDIRHWKIGSATFARCPRPQPAGGRVRRTRGRGRIPRSADPDATRPPTCCPIP